MGRKKKEEELSVHDMVTAIPQDKLHKLVRFEAEMVSLQSQIKCEKMAREFILAKIDPNGTLAKMEQTIQELTASYHTKKENFLKYRNDVSDMVGVDLAKCSYDDETGTVHEFTPAPEK